jgi:polyketide synthase PksN
MNALNYIFGEVKDGRLSKSDAIALLRQFHTGNRWQPSIIHPLLHANTSDQSERRFSSTFTGAESFLSDHVVNGARVMPAAAYLEMARTAVDMVGARGDGNKQRCRLQIQLKNVVFARPLIVDGATEVHITLRTEDAGETAYEIYTLGAPSGACDGLTGESEKRVYCRGHAVLLSDAESSLPGDRVDILRLQSLCRRTLSAAQCYETFLEMRVQYGDAHRGLESVADGVDGNGKIFVLARFVLPGAVADTHREFTLHPSIMDAALQAVIGWNPSQGDGSDLEKLRNPSLPFAVERVDIFSPCPTNGWAFLRASAPENGEGKIQKLDVDVCDELGEVCVRLLGLSLRVLEDAAIITSLFKPQWQMQEQELVPTVEDGSGERWIVLCDPGEPQSWHSLYEEYLQGRNLRLGNPQHLVLSSSSDHDSRRATDYLLQSFQLIQRILQQKPRREVLIQIVVPQGPVRTLFTGIFGLLQTAHLENPMLLGQMIEIEPGETPEGLAQKLRENIRLGARHHVRYVDGQRQAVGWEKLTTVGESGPWKEGGVYLITGGAGGLGRLFAREIAMQAAGAKVILAGRSELSEDELGELKSLAADGAQIDYWIADISHGHRAAGLVEKIHSKFGSLNGILHSAGVIRDSFLLKKTREDFEAVLAPKLAGLVNLDEATKSLKLDFFVLFSSLAAVTGNVGQGDYAGANAFMDAYAEYRNSLVKAGQRHGRTLSINWPVWEEGGMGRDAATVGLMRRAGLTPMPTAAGIRALYRAFSSEESQLIVLAGNVAKLSGFLAEPASALGMVETSAVTEVCAGPERVPGEELEARAVRYLKRLLAVPLKLPMERMEGDAAFEKYGMDSILVMQLTGELEKRFGSLSKTLFFEYQNLEELAGYFVQEHRERMLSILNLEAGAGAGKSRGTRAAEPAVVVEAAAVKPEARPAISSSGKFEPKERAKEKEKERAKEKEKERAEEKERAKEKEKGNEKEEEEIAIVGMSGRYPQARNLREFWENLKAGKDCITEVPRERWDHRKYYDAEKGKMGKSYSKWGGFMEGVEEFDAMFFNISPREAQAMDPQERLFLQCVYEVLEDAGYTRESLGRYRGQGLEGNVGVFVGVMYEEYQLYAAEAQALGQPYGLFGNPSSIANRVSYYCNWHGPSLALDTMCSSSLTALHLACESLRGGGCEAAIAGGVNVSIHPNKYLVLAQGQFVSSVGRCESFGEGGDGYVPGEGVGAVLLKPLWRAEADGDQIYGVIKGSAINHGGKTNGYSVPNPQAQANVIGQAVKAAGLEAGAISYIEAHGTGTSLGDPIEMAGLSKAWEESAGEEKKRRGEERKKEERKPKPKCAIGSVKSNIGHCESAAGIAGVSKVLLQMKHGMLVPSLHAEKLNPHIDFEKSGFAVQRELGEWKRREEEDEEGRKRECARIAGVSSFGAGGSNAHVVIGEYVGVGERGRRGGAGAGAWSGEEGKKKGEERAREREEEREAVVILSARTEEQLRRRVEQLLEALQAEGDGEKELRDVAYTLQVGREALEHRLGMTAGTMGELQEKLGRWLGGEEGMEGVHRGQVKRSREEMGVFNGDEDLGKLIGVWLEKGKYGKVLEMWMKGLAVDWGKMYEEGARPCRISLPTYPFARERYWAKVDGVKRALDNQHSDLSSSKHASQVTAMPGNKEGEESIERSERFLSKTWRLSMLTQPTASLPGVVIFATAETKDLAVQLGKRFPQSQVLIDSALSPEAQTQIPWSMCKGWIDLVGWGREKNDSLEWIINLQAWIEQNHQEGLALCVTRGLEAYRNSKINLSGALHAGLYRMLQSEYRHIRSRHIDVDSSIDELSAIDQIVSEFAAQSDEPEVCFRHGQRFSACLDEVGGGITSAEEGKLKPAFSKEAVLWITGGTRGIGYLCAQHFVRHYGVRRLLLTGQEHLPAREKWDAEQHGDGSAARKIRSIRALETEGAEVRVSSVDLTDEHALQNEIEEVTESMGPIAGILHCAGAVNFDNPAFTRKTPKDMRSVLAPKVAGLNGLVKCLAGQPLQFFILFSSASAIIPSLAPGQADYAMANAYMDYMAEGNRDKFPIVSIQWPNWKETGMGEVKSRAYRLTGLLSHTNAEGLRLLDSILASEVAPVTLPAIVDADQWQPERLMKRTIQDDDLRRLPRASRDPAGVASHADRLVRATHDWLRSLASEQLDIEFSKVEIDTPLQDYGVDSVMIMQLLRQVSEVIKEKLDPSLLFEYPTIQSFTRWLMTTYPDRLAEAVPGPASGAAVVTSEAVGPMPSHSNVPTAVGGSNWSEIAVVGLSCRFPGAKNLGEYWQLLAQGRSAIGAVPADRLPHANGYYAGLLDNVTHFDPGFFLIPESTAAAMDPQALLVLEESLNTWHHAGYSLDEIKGSSTGVYFGGRSQHRPNDTILFAAQDPIVAVGQNYLAANVSRFFDLRGPGLVIDTACSSALVAMNIAVQALRCGEISAALVGGVSILDSDAGLRIFDHRGILQPEPRFHIFDQRARGTVLGEGVGMVLLKTREKALEDGDRIYALIKSIAVNNDGRTPGPTAPNFQTRKDLMLSALNRSGKRAEDISYIDVNGSGSEITDLLELKAIEAVYRAGSHVPCGLGSMKPNIGHPLCAEGIASLIKVVLMLHHKQWVPFLSAEQPMTHYDLASSPFYFCRTLTEWQKPAPVAAINCFADGGTNAHVILEGYQKEPGDKSLRQPMAPPELHRVDLRFIGTSKSSPALLANGGGAVSQPTNGSRRVSINQTPTRAVFWKQSIESMNQQVAATSSAAD